MPSGIYFYLERGLIILIWAAAAGIFINFSVDFLSMKKSPNGEFKSKPTK